MEFMNQDYRLCHPGPTAELIMFFVHFDSVCVFAVELENDMIGINGSVSGFILSHGKRYSGYSRLTVVKYIVRECSYNELGIRNRQPEIVSTAVSGS